LPSAEDINSIDQETGDPVTMILSILRHSDVIICRECGVMLNTPPAARDEAQKWMWDHVQKDHPDVIRGPVIFDATTFVPLGVTPPWEPSSTTPDDPAALDVPYEDADGFTAIPEESPTCP
jgi:hypothetical protein